MGKIEKVIETARLIKSLQELGEVLRKAHHPDIVAGVRVPKQLHEHDEPVPHEHPHRELAAKFVLDVHRKNKFEGARMSEKYLGIGGGGKALHPNALPPDQRTKYIDIKDEVKKSLNSNQLKSMIVALGMATAPHVHSQIPAMRQAIHNENLETNQKKMIAQHFGLKDEPDYVMTGTDGQTRVIPGRRAHEKVTPELRDAFLKEKGIPEQDTMSAVKKADNPNKYVEGVHKPFAPGLGAAGISGQGYTVRGAMRTISPEGNRGQEFRQPQGGPHYDRELARDKSKRILNQLKNMPKPNLPKSELDKASVNVQPAIVSSPLIVNPAGMPIDEKKVSNSPAVMNPYKMDKNCGVDKVSKLLSSLKGRK